MSYHIFRILGLFSAGVIAFAQAREHTSSGSSAHTEWLNIPTEPLGDQGHKKNIPDYVLEYAPLVHLAENEIHWPSVMDEHLLHTIPYLDYEPVPKSEQHPTVSNLAELNNHDEGTSVYLQSRDDVMTNPAWMLSEHNIPVPPPATPEHNGTKSAGSDENEDSGNQKKISKRGGRSPSPAVLAVVEKEDGVVLAFWFFFYSYNLGNSVFGVGFGDHVGDWEHSVTKFRNGIPEAMFFSQHVAGRSYKFDALEKYGKRPVIYSAKGSHALYPTPGIQAYILPFAILHDTTTHGPLWDPALNVMSYHYMSPDDLSDVGSKVANDPSVNASTFTPGPGTLTPSLENPDAPTSWFYYGGCWGDKGYLPNDPRQYEVPIIGERKFVDGPFGPRFKAMGRRDVCIQGQCTIYSTIAPRLWLLNWLYNWAWVCGCLLALAGVGIIGFTLGRHMQWGHTMLVRLTKRGKRVKLLEDDVERSPLLDEVADDDTPSVVALEIDGARAVTYGTMNAVVAEDTNRVG